MTTKNDALKLGAAFDKRFTSMNGVDVPERVSVPRDEWRALHAAIKQALAAPTVQEPVLQEIEQYRLQMAGISTAALGYWTEGDSMHPDYDTPALRDVAKLYANYAALHAAAQPAVPEGMKLVPVAEVGGGKTFQDLDWLENPPQLDNGTVLYVMLAAHGITKGHS